ncbi:unnamed protein product [Ectocarpus sp. 12 AP-2014]
MALPASSPRAPAARPAAGSAAVPAVQLLATAPSPVARVRFLSTGCLAASPPALSKVTVRRLVRRLASSAPSSHRQEQTAW